MKKINLNFWHNKLTLIIPFLLFLLFAIPLTNLFAQNKNESADKLEKRPLLFIGIANPLDISIKGIPDNKIEVKGYNCEVRRTKNTNTNFEVIISNEDSPEIVQVAVLVKGQEVCRYSYQAEIIPYPVAAINKQSSGKMSRKEILQAGKISVTDKFDFFLKYAKYKIISFSINGANGVELPAKNDNFTKEQIAYINSLQPQQQLIVSNIKTSGSDGHLRNLSPIVLSITK